MKYKELTTPFELLLKKYKKPSFLPRISKFNDLSIK